MRNLTKLNMQIITKTLLSLATILLINTSTTFSQTEKSSTFGLKILSPGLFLDYKFTDKLYIVSELGFITGYTYEPTDEEKVHNLLLDLVKIEPRYKLNELFFVGTQLKYLFWYPAVQPLTGVRNSFIRSYGLHATVGLRKQWKRFYIDLQTGVGTTYVSKTYDPSFNVGFGVGFKLTNVEK